MFSDICPDVYRWLRERSGLSQAELGRKLAASRSAVCSWEIGRSRLSREKEKALLDAVKWGKEPFVELVCEKLSLLLGKRVTILHGREHERYRPATPLARAEALVRTHYVNIPESLRRVLSSRIHSVRTRGTRLERDNQELEELIEACLRLLDIDVHKEQAELV